MATYWENSCSFGLRYVSWYKYLIVSLVFSHLGFWSGNLFLIAPFPDLCLLVPFSFPTLFCGNTRPDNSQRTVNVTYGDICKSELRCSDRRMAGHIPNIFFKYKKLQTKHILDKANICIRKTKRNQDLTAAYLKASGNVENCVDSMKDSGFSKI